MTGLPLLTRQGLRNALAQVAISNHGSRGQNLTRKFGLQGKIANSAEQAMQEKITRKKRTLGCVLSK